MALKTLMRFFIVLMEIQKAQVEPAEWPDKAAKAGGTCATYILDD